MSSAVIGLCFHFGMLKSYPELLMMMLNGRIPRLRCFRRRSGFVVVIVFLAFVLQQ